MHLFKKGIYVLIKRVFMYSLKWYLCNLKKGIYELI